MILNENENGTLTDMSDIAEQTSDTSGGVLEIACEASEEMRETPNEAYADSENVAEETHAAEHQTDAPNAEREEYERLIKTRFKDLYAEDTQRLINKRFKRYKQLEEKVRDMEEVAKRYSDIDALIASEVEKAILETEQRMTLHFQRNANRVSENASLRAEAPSLTDVSKLTRSQRASLANRALNGEKIRF